MCCMAAYVSLPRLRCRNNEKGLFQRAGMKGEEEEWKVLGRGRC